MSRSKNAYLKMLCCLSIHQVFSKDKICKRRLDGGNNNHVSLYQMYRRDLRMHFLFLENVHFHGSILSPSFPRSS